MLTEFFDTLVFSLSVTGPIFVILGLGAGLKRIGMMTDAFIEGGSRLVFTVTLPALLFINVSQAHLDTSTNFTVILIGLAATFFVWIVSEWLARAVVKNPRDRGVVVQGIFRSNAAIIGLAYCANAFGPAGLAAGSVYIGLVTILYNILAVITLSASLNAKQQSLRSVLRAVALNPLIIGIGLAIPVSLLGLALPKVLLKSGEYFANMTLPLALLCTGATLNFRSLRDDPRDTLAATIGKIIIVPILFTSVGVALDLRGVDLGVLLLMSSAPSAAAGYVMVRAMGGNAALAANIVALTTVGSLFTTSAGIVILKGFGLI